LATIAADGGADDFCFGGAMREDAGGVAGCVVAADYIATETSGRAAHHRCCTTLA